MIVLGFSGRARHGKTECTEAIYSHIMDNEHDSRQARVYDVGNMIRRMAIAEGRLPQVERKDMTKEQLQVLIDLGKEMRAVDHNYWVKQIIAAIEQEKPDVAMCPNVRLPQEAEAFESIGGFMVRCTRLNADGSLYISPDRDPNDITETALQFWPCKYHITTVTGVDARLVRMQAVTLFRYLTGE
jgi:hypothetical protein